VNGDGHPDLLVANSYYSDSIGVMLGNGDGTFRSAVNYPSGGGFPMGIVAVDIDGDGKLDLIVMNQTPCYSCTGNGNIAVLLGRGDGSFKAAKTYDSGGVGPAAGNLGPNPMAVVDVNGDGKLDVVVENCAPSGSGGCGDGNGTVGVLLGNGDGTFRPVVTYDSGISLGGTGLAVGDLNGDGKPDLVVTSWCINSESCPPGRVGVLLGNGDGTFGQSVKHALAGWNATGIALADLNHDGNLDVVVGGCGSSNCWGPNGIVTVLLGKGDGTFKSAVGYDAGGRLADGLVVADVNGDGRLDVVVADTIDSSVGVLLGKNDGTFFPGVTFGSGNFSYSVAVADVDGDGRPDVMVAGLGAIVGVLINSSKPLVATTTALATSKNPATPGLSVTFTATVSAASGTPTGTVIFYDRSMAVGSATLAGGSASLSWSSLVRGNHYITAAYQGSSDFAPSTSAVLKEVVNLTGLFGTETRMNHPPTSYVGQPVTFRATVTSKGGAIPDGDLVTFADNLTTIGSGTTVGGVASFTTSTLKAGSHIIRAFFQGDENFAKSFTGISQLVLKYPTTTALTSSLNPAVYGQSITFTATVKSAGPHVATGSVRFVGLGKATLIGGVATLTKPRLRAGSYALTAEYLGDDASAISTSPVLNQVVNPASTKTVLRSSANPSSSGQSVTFTATVTSSTGLNPFGTVTFKAGTTTLGTVAVIGTKASISTATLPTGSTIIKAAYSGSAGFTKSSASLTQVVNP
jgi:hypothetical protein